MTRPSPARPAVLTPRASPRAAPAALARAAADDPGGSRRHPPDDADDWGAVDDASRAVTESYHPGATTTTPPDAPAPKSAKDSTAPARRVDTSPLEGIRTCACAVIAANHWLSWYGEKRHGAIELQGGFAVTVFFFITGFVLYLAYADKCCAKDFSFAAFIKRRYVRLVPVHWLCIAFYAPVIYFNYETIARDYYFWQNASGERHLWAGWILNPFFLHAWIFAPLHYWNGVAWSVSTQVGFYFLFPTVARRAKRLFAREEEELLTREKFTPSDARGSADATDASEDVEAADKTTAAGDTITAGVKVKNTNGSDMAPAVAPAYYPAPSGAIRELHAHALEARHVRCARILYVLSFAIPFAAMAFMNNPRFRAYWADPDVARDVDSGEEVVTELGSDIDGIRAYFVARSWTPFRLPVFLLGVLFAARRERLRRVGDDRDPDVRAYWAALADRYSARFVAYWFLSSAFSLAYAESKPVRLFSEFFLVYPFAFVLYGLTVADASESRAVRFLTHPLMLAGGRISYAAYLLQFPVWSYVDFFAYGTFENRFPPCSRDDPEDVSSWHECFAKSGYQEWPDVMVVWNVSLLFAVAYAVNRWFERPVVKWLSAKMKL